MFQAADRSPLKMPGKRYCLLCILVCLALVDLSRRLLLSRSLYDLNLAVGARLATLDAPRPTDRILIFAPHPDDETIATGAYIQQAVAAGADVRVAVVTNGEYPDMSVVVSERTLRRRPAEFIRLGDARQRETLAAMSYLGLPADHVIFLGYPNGYLDQMWSPLHWPLDRPILSVRTRTTRSPYANSYTPNTPYCGQAVLDDVERLLLSFRPTVVIAPHPNDLHLDHWSTGAFVRAALEQLRLDHHPFADTCQVYTYLVHRNHWPVPRGYKPWLTLEPPASLLALGTTDWRFLPVSLAQTIDKHHATTLYHTQGGGIDPLLDAFSRATELFGIVPVSFWPAGKIVSPTLAIQDTQHDLDLAARRAYADIAQVTLFRRDAVLVADVVTRGVPGAKVGYHLSLHVGAADPSRGAIAVLDWTANSVQGMLLRGGALNRIPPDRIRYSTSGRLMRVQLPWLIPDDVPAYFIVRAWSTADPRVLDQTAFTTFRVGEPSRLSPPMHVPRRDGKPL